MWRLPLILMEQTSLEPQLLEVGPDAARGAMVRACLAAGVPRFTPYDLRHRRTSLWHGQGVPTKELMRRTGHSKSSTTIDVYSHANFDLT
jgi:integrase